MNAFRTQFNFLGLSKDMNYWFPGHMAKSLKKMYEQLTSVDAIIEVHDARIPFSGRNSKFRQTIVGNKPYAFVLNKADLADLTHREKIVKKLEEQDSKPCFFTVMKKQNDSEAQKILPSIIDQIKSQDRFNREVNTNYHIMIVGVPNVGKFNF